MESTEIDSEYRIQSFTLDSFLLMNELSKSAFGTGLSPAGFQKKYDTEKWFGSKVIGFFAIHSSSNTPAAFYGVFPVKVLIDGKEVLAAQSGDTMTHKLHRKKGLFKKLALITYEACRQQGIEMLFGQPNKSSYHGLTHSLKWIHLDEIAGYDLKIPLKTIPFPKLLKKAGMFSWYVKYARLVLKKYMVNEMAEFTNQVQSKLGRVLRNAHYLNYKKEDDKIFIRLHNVVLWIKLSDVLWIGDVNDYQNAAPGLIIKLQKIAFRLGYNTIRFHSNVNLPASLLTGFKKCGTEASCFFYLNEGYKNQNLVLTGCDFDTW